MRLLTVFNICKNSSDNRDNCNSYVESINSILNQDLEFMSKGRKEKIENKLAISAVRNTRTCLDRLQNEFKGKSDLIYYGEPWTVNITFNKSVQEMVNRYGNFDGYIYIDSGCILNDPNTIKTMADRLSSNIDYSMVTIQTDTDNGFRAWLNFDHVDGQDYIIPVGGCCNLHCQLFSHELFETYGKRIIPDIFKAYCTESVFSFLNSAIHKRWIIAKDIIVQHRHGLDGGSIYHEKKSPKFGTDWNNLLYERNALEFINNPEVIDAGLGYEEYHGIMMHRIDKHENNLYSQVPERLKAVILKYLFLNNNELNYDSIPYTFNAYG